MVVNGLEWKTKFAAVGTNFENTQVDISTD